MTLKEHVRRATKVVAIASPKGGVGKSTVCGLLAVEAVSRGRKVGLVDLNSDQGNLTIWWSRRDEPDNPKLIDDYQDFVKDMRALKEAGEYDYVIVDSPPMVDHTDVVEAAVVAADCVVIPVKASIFDIDSMPALVEICKERRKPFAFLRSDVDNGFTSLNQETLTELTKDGDVFAAQVSHRAPYVSALTDGLTGPEVSKDKMIRGEIAALWNEVEKLAQRPLLPKKVANVA